MSYVSKPVTVLAAHGPVERGADFGNDVQERGLKHVLKNGVPVLNDRIERAEEHLQQTRWLRSGTYLQ